MDALTTFCAELSSRLQLVLTDIGVRWPMSFQDAEKIFANPSARDRLLLQGCEAEPNAFANLRRLIRDYDLARVCPEFYRRHTLSPAIWKTLSDDALDDLEDLLMKEQFELQNARGIVWAFASEDLEKKTLRRKPGCTDSGAEYLCHLLSLADISMSHKLILIGYKRSDVPPKRTESSKSGLRVPTPLDGLGYDMFEIRACDKRGGVTAAGGIREAVHPGTTLHPSLVAITNFTLRPTVGA